VADYTRRLGKDLRLQIEEIRLGQRHADAPPDRAVADEGKRLLAALGKDDYVVALDVGGRALSTEQWADWLRTRLQEGRDVTFLIGGPDGLAEACLARADLRLSLSSLTFPHALVRVVLVEQLYRALSILRNHPYHRA
jgi:23S rRNA (pseudouridine1915-N3)-methyltransferase